MGVSFNETVSTAKEESDCIGGGARFQVEKRQRIGEGLGDIKMQDCEGQPHRTKRPYNDE